MFGDLFNAMLDPEQKKKQMVSDKLPNFAQAMKDPSLGVVSFVQPSRLWHGVWCGFERDTETCDGCRALCC